MIFATLTGYMELRVRAAELTDIDWLVSECKAFAQIQKTKRSIFPADESTSKEILQDMVKNHLFLIAVRGEQKLGFLAAYQFKHPFNPAIRVLTEAFWWVSQAFRGSRAGLLLLITYIEYGRAHAEWIFLGLQNDSPVSPAALIRRGFRPHESQFLLEV